MTIKQMNRDMTDQMVEAALSFCARQACVGDAEQARQALHQGQCDVCDYLCYSLAKQVGEFLSQMDETVKAVYVFEPEYAWDGDTAAARRPSGINLIAWVDRKSASLDALAGALGTTLSESRRNKLGCVKATAPCNALNVHLVDDADVENRRGYGAMVDSLYIRPIKVWARVA